MSLIHKPSFLAATVQIVPNILKPAIPAISQKQSIFIEKSKPGLLKLPKGAISISNSIAGKVFQDPRTTGTGI